MKNKGITLIALTVTVIVLLIISGVTISYLTGENGIINQAKDSKKFAGAVEEKEVLNTSVAAAIGKSSNSKIDEVNLKKYLNQNVGDEVKDYTLEKKDGYYSVTFTATGNEYAVWENGTVQDMEEYQKTPYLKLDPSELNALEKGSSQVIKAITNVNNSNIKWETSNSNIVTIQKKSNTEITVTGKNNGSAVITAKMDKLETKCQVTVLTSPKEIILSNTEITIDLSSGNKTVQITPTITPDSANKNITWTSSNTSIARVDEFGTITGISNGEATVTAKTVNGLTKICKVKVVTSPTAISLNKTNAVIDTTTSKNMQLTAVITPASANIYTGITWTSSNDNVVQVNQQGLVKGISNGLATVTAKTENGCTAQCRIVVGATIAGINLAPSNSAIEIEEKLQINATIEPNTSEETLIWVSSNSKVATVDQNGLVTGKSHGTVTITATGRDSMVANSVKVTVQTAPKSISLNITEKTIDLSTDAKSFQLIGTISPSTANVYLEQTWTSNDESVAKVDNNGRVTALKNGDATITVSTGNKKTATCKVKVVTSPTGIALDKNRATVNLSGTKTVDLTATLTPKTANIYDDLQWSSDSASAKVEKTGKYTARVTGVSNGNAKITVSTGNGYKAECIVTVETKIIGITVSPNEAEVEVGSTVTLTATKKPSIGSTEGLVWSSSNNRVAKVNDDGVVTGIAQGTVTITIKSSSGLVKTKAKVTVVQSPTGITLDKNKVALDMSGTKTTKLNATIQPSNANRNTGITWNSSNTGVATVDQSGNVTAKANGTTTITATTQNGYTAQCSITVITSITSLSVSPTSKTLNIGETVQLTGTKNPSTTSEGTQWTSSNTSVATVNNSGLVTAKSAGTATITFKNSSSTKFASCNVTIVSSDIIIGGNTGFDATNVILKYNNNGNLVWKKDVTTNSYSNAFKCDINAVGTFKDGSIIVGAGASSYDNVIIKYDKNGNTIWKKSIPTYYYNSKNQYYKINTINITNDDNIIVGANSQYDGAEKIIIKYDSNGNLIWKKTLPTYKSGEYYYVEQLLISNDNNIIIGVDSYSDSQGRAILKYDSNGNLIWNKKIPTYTDYGSTYFYRIASMSLLKDNSIIIGANCGTLREDSTTPNALLKYNNNGDLIWKKDVTTNTRTNGFDCSIKQVLCSTDENIIVSAGGDTVSDSQDKVIIKYDKNGNLIWKKSVPTYYDNGETRYYRISTTNINNNNEIIVGANGSTDSSSKSLLKYDSNGNLIWKKDIPSYKSGEYYYIEKMNITNKNEIIVGVDSYSDSQGRAILKYNNNGELLWKTELPKYTYNSYNEFYRLTTLNIY